MFSRPCIRPHCILFVTTLRPLGWYRRETRKRMKKKEKYFNTPYIIGAIYDALWGCFFNGPIKKNINTLLSL